MGGRGPDGVASRRIGDIGEASTRPGLPEGLHVRERPPAGGWEGYGGPVVIFVHGGLDRGASFGRTALRLPELGLVTYDRRGYRGSRGAGAARLPVHVEDLIRIAGAYAGPAPPPPAGQPSAAVPPAGQPSADVPPAKAAGRVVAVGHSVGATLVLWAGVAAPRRFAALAAYEPSMPWLGFHRTAAPTAGDGRPVGPAPDADPAEEAERFFRRMVGNAAWERLGDQERASRRADGPALLEDLRGIRVPAPFDVTALRVPTVVAAGGPASLEHHRQTVAWLADHVAAVQASDVREAGHGAHLSHPDAFAALVRLAVSLA